MDYYPLNPLGASSPEAPKTLDIQPESQIDLSGKVTGLAVKSDDPKSGNFVNNFPLTCAGLEIYATHATQGEKAGSRLGNAVYSKTIGEDGKWGPFRAKAEGMRNQSAPWRGRVGTLMRVGIGALEWKKPPGSPAV